MKVLILAVSLAVMQATPPVPRKTADPSTNAGHSVQKDAQSDKAPAAEPSGIPQKKEPPKTEQERDRTGTTNAEHTVRIREPVPVSVIKDWADYLGIFSSFLLFIIGALGVGYAVKTLKAISKQAELMDGQLGEMKAAGTQVAQQVILTTKQVEYIVNTERAWVMGELGWYEKVGPNVKVSTATGEERTTAYIKLTCRNQGKSPAWIDHVYGALSIVHNRSTIEEMGADDRDNFGDNGRIGPLGAGEERSTSVYLTCSGSTKDKEFLSAYVIVEYRDIFGIKRETFLGYSIIPPDWSLGRQDGLPNRNRNT